MNFERSHADDIRQVGDIAAWKAMQSFDPACRLPAKLWRGMAVNRAVVDYLRAWNHSRSYGAGVRFTGLDGHDAAYMPAHTPEPRIERAIEALPARAQKALRMRFWEDCKLHEIADAIGVSESRAHAIIQAALAAIRKKLT